MGGENGKGRRGERNPCTYKNVLKKTVKKINMYISMCIYMCKYVYICVYIVIYMYILSKQKEYKVIKTCSNIIFT